MRRVGKIGRRKVFPEVKNVNAKSPKKRSKLLFFSSGRGVEDDDRLERERVRVGDSVASLMVRERPLPSKTVIYRISQKSKTGST